MAKKGFFSWFRKDKPAPEVEEQQQTDAEVSHDVATDTAEQTQQAELQKQATEAARVEAVEIEKQQLEQQRIENELAEQARLDAQRMAAEAEALAAEKLAAEQLAAQQEAERQEQQRIENERAEQARVEAERLAAEKFAAEQEAARVEAERLEQLRIENERAEQARLEADRIAAETAALAAEKLAAEQLAAQELAEQQAAEEARLEQARLEAEAIAEEALAAEKLALEQAPIESIELELQDEPQEKPKKEGMFARLKRGLMRTSENIGSGFIGLFSGKKIDDDLFEELEEQLLIADVGVETTTKLIKSLTEHASRKQLKNAEALYDLMRDEMQKMLEPVAIPLVPDNADGPFVILMVGVNGVGKTTTIGKLAKQYQNQGKSVMLAAGDTFRAAAVEQLQVWGQRNNIPVVAQHTGADSASVLFDALQAAKARKVDVLIADTAGRLQNKSHLMEELKKVVRVMKKLDPNTPHEVMLTLDASTGQNAISQAQLFQEAVGVTGLTISKLDGTAKGGVIFAIADKFNIPIRHIGVGEQIDDLRTFNANDFIEALFSQEKTDQ
ncbi:signal recognition particle receptor FtsY [Shewanella algicola]|uniref:Signal recognition particle receptor FtsY n=1 Tax=Shewanella algicola TaxID=640633 RepID=A0A9X1ZGV3_9GAMM|nr:signal recognition particle-docking protein FtsY [Shewanella algicola]MCL1106573.1 signal recognition particle-docking protein FtsY [Shewanella algicola]GGP60079.1 signal recognition particle receptor FtsY [Shewanella algicola]